MTIIVDATSPSDALVDDELAAIVTALASRYPTLSSDLVQHVIADTHRDLTARSRITAHLIPLTLNLSRRRLQAIAMGMTTTET
ncbi:MAG: hypothetical protein J0H22_10485 [Actinobacteria bacterium]|nr:hypothetical protein [Actinomycetota bacterium]